MTRHPAPSAAAAELREKHLSSICGGDPSTDPLPGHLRRPRTAEDRGQRIGIFLLDPALAIFWETSRAKTNCKRSSSRLYSPMSGQPIRPWDEILDFFCIFQLLLYWETLLTEVSRISSCGKLYNKLGSWSSYQESHQHRITPEIVVMFFSCN